MAKAEGHRLAVPIVAHTKEVIDVANGVHQSLEKFNQEAAVEGRGYHSKKKLDDHMAGCEDIFRIDKELEQNVKSILSVAATPITPRQPTAARPSIDRASARTSMDRAG